MNAIAEDENGALFDPFGGKEDIEKRLIRCVGNAETRFKEDALRILRALRFSAVLSFSIEEETSRAIRSFLISFRTNALQASFRCFCVQTARQTFF